MKGGKLKKFKLKKKSVDKDVNESNDIINI